MGFNPLNMKNNDIFLPVFFLLKENWYYNLRVRNTAKSKTVPKNKEKTKPTTEK